MIVHLQGIFPPKQAVKTIQKLLQNYPHSERQQSVSTNRLKLETGAMTTCRVYKLLLKE